jgi:hypothetical protein
MLLIVPSTLFLYRGSDRHIAINPRTDHSPRQGWERGTLAKITPSHMIFSFVRHLANAKSALSTATHKLLECGLNFSIEAIGQRRHRWALENLRSYSKLEDRTHLLGTASRNELAARWRKAIAKDISTTHNATSWGDVASPSFLLLNRSNPNLIIKCPSNLSF